MVVPEGVEAQNFAVVLQVLPQSGGETHFLAEQLVLIAASV